MEHCVKLGVYARRVANKTSRSGERGRRATELALPCQVAAMYRVRTCVALHRRIVVARRSTGSLLQLLALGGFAAVKTVINCFYLATLPPQADGHVIFSPLLLFLAICTWWLKKSGQYGTINI